MASVLKLVRGSTELSLLARPGLCLGDDAWQAGVAESTPGRIPPYVVENMPIRLTGASQDDMAATMQSLHAMAEGAARYWSDRTESTPVWLHAKLVEETGERRALVRSIQFRFADDWYSEEAKWADLAGTLVIERHPYWEAVTPVTLPEATLVGAAADVYDYTATPAGDVPGDAGGRLAPLSLATFGSAWPEGGALDRIWIGLRSRQKHPGWFGYFTPVWECENPRATLGTSATRVADTTASPGEAGDTLVRVTPGTATLAKRLRIRLSDIIGSSATHSAEFGLFAWLLRARVSTGSWRVHLRYGHYHWLDGRFVRGPEFDVSNTNWDIYHAGVRSIPLAAERGAGKYGGLALENRGYGSYTVEVWAERTSGSGTLDLDCLCLVPVDEGFAFLSGAALYSVEGGPAVCWLDTSPADEVSSASFGDLAVRGLTGRAVVSAQNLYLPPGEGCMVIVYARTGGSALGETLVVGHGGSAIYYPRYLSLRGAK